MSQTTQKTQSDQIEVGALWEKEGKAQKFFSGTINFAKLPKDKLEEFNKTKTLQVVVFNNKYKQNGSHPDLRVYLSKPREGDAPAPAPAAEADTDVI